MSEEQWSEEPLEEEEREAIRQDLDDVEFLKDLLGPKGIKGAVFYCPDCSEDHYLDWDLLSGNLQKLLDEGESPMHEPAYEPDLDAYVSWDYASGFLDGYQSYEEDELTDKSLRLILALKQRGWAPDEVRGLFAAIGLEFPSVSPSADG